MTTATWRLPFHVHFVDQDGSVLFTTKVIVRVEICDRGGRAAFLWAHGPSVASPTSGVEIRLTKAFGAWFARREGEEHEGSSSDPPRQATLNHRSHTVQFFDCRCWVAAGAIKHANSVRSGVNYSSMDAISQVPTLQPVARRENGSRFSRLELVQCDLTSRNGSAWRKFRNARLLPTHARASTAKMQPALVDLHEASAPSWR